MNFLYIGWLYRIDIQDQNNTDQNIALYVIVYIQEVEDTELVDTLEISLTS